MTSSEVSSLTHGMNILKMAVSREKSGRAGFGVSRTADELDLDRGRVSRLTQELCVLGLLEKPDGSTLRAGEGYFSLADSLNRGWVRRIRPDLRLLVSQYRLSARVSVRLDERVLLLRAENEKAIGTTAAAGMITPVWCTGAGRALLWDHTNDELGRLLDDVEFVGVGGPNAAHSVEELIRLMDRDRPQGFVDAPEEFEHVIRELAVPIRNVAGQIVAALSVLGSDSNIRNAAPEICTSLATIAEQLTRDESLSRM